MGKIIFKLFILSIGAMVVTGCAAGYCRGRDPKLNAMTEQKVFVYKPDGTLQCSKKKGISVETMADELKGIQIFSKANKPDGQMHMTLCNSPTGQINVYEIPQKDLAKAISLGFKELKN